MIRPMPWWGRPALHFMFLMVNWAPLTNKQLSWLSTWIIRRIGQARGILPNDISAGVTDDP